MMGERLLITHRESAILLERARIRVNGGRVVYDLADGGTVRTFNIPYANIAVIFMGQGCSITTDACRLLGEEGVSLAMTGTGGTPITFGTLINYRPTNHFRRAMTAWLSEQESLIVAKNMAEMRIENMMSIGLRRAQRGSDLTAEISEACQDFGQKIQGCRTGAELLGAEGLYARMCYKAYAKNIMKDERFVREPGKRAAGNRNDVANSMIDHGNYIIYGLAGAALWALGVPPHLSVLHGRTRAGGLVFDIADIFKDSLVLPEAFEMSGSRAADKEKVFRAKLLEETDKRKTLEKIFEAFNKCFPEERA